MADSKRQVREPKSPNFKQRRLILGVAAVTTILVAGWFFSPVERTIVFLDVEVAEAEFRLEEDQDLLGVIRAARLSISGLSAVDMALPGAQGPEGLAAAVGATTLDLAERSRGEISLGGLALRQGTTVTLRPGRPEHPQIAFAGPETKLRATADGPVLLDQREVDLQSPEPIDMSTPSEGEVVLELEPKLPLELAPHFRVSHLVLHHETERADGSSRAQSTILGGTLVVREIDATERTIRLREPLTFEQSEGVIQSLSFRDGRWILSFEGTVQGMQAGYGSDRRSEMPTRGEWLQARHGVWFFAGGAIYVLGLAYGVMRWMGIDK